MARACIDKKIKSVIGISTDKATPPQKNLYGISKSAMERIFLNANELSNTNFLCVRFGNIAWSTGSVFPIWKRMMEDNGLIESTGPNMKRFFFSVSDAADLVIRNLDNIHTTRGKVLSMKMKASKILNLLNAWQKLYGTKWIEIDRRLGESDHESMIGSIELKYTAEIILDERDHFLTSFRDPLTEHAQDVFTTEFAEHHSEEEMIDLIKLGTLS